MLSESLSRAPGPSRAVQSRIFRRDQFHCRYCGGKTIPILELLGAVFPEQFPYHPNWKGGETHPAVLSRCAIIDHVDPGSQSGNWLEEDNLATACW